MILNEVLNYRFLFRSRVAFNSVTPAFCISVRHVGKKLGVKRDFARKPLRVYSPSGELLSEKTQLMKESSVESNSSLLFSKIMSEIIDNRNKKRIALEGRRLLQEAVNTGVKVEFIFMAKSMRNLPERLQSSLNISLTQIHRVGDDQFKLWSSLTTSPGIIGICTKPSTISRQSGENNLLPVSIICDNIREPGNLGSILRSAAAAGCVEVILSKGCVDPWESKVFRGGCGAHFYLPIVPDVPVEFLGNYITTDTAESALQARHNYDDATDRNRIAVLIADNNLNNSRFELSASCYSDIDYTQFSKLFLIIGGETEGLSDQTLKLTQTMQFPKGAFIKRINIPLCNNFESLNAAHACSVITFEIARQFRARQKV